MFRVGCIGAVLWLGIALFVFGVVSVWCVQGAVLTFLEVNLGTANPGYHA